MFLRRANISCLCANHSLEARKGVFVILNDTTPLASAIIKDQDVRSIVRATFDVTETPVYLTKLCQLAQAVFKLYHVRLSMLAEV